MGWKLVRDLNEAWCRPHGVSGQWRTSPDPRAALRRKIFEEAGEYAEHGDPAELYDLLNVVQALIDMEDPDGTLNAQHAAKVALLGGFTQFVEWTPVPAEIGGPLCLTRPRRSAASAARPCGYGKTTRRPHQARTPAGLTFQCPGTGHPPAGDPPCTPACRPGGTIAWPLDYERGKPHASTHVCDSPSHQAEASQWVQGITGHEGVFRTFEQPRAS